MNLTSRRSLLLGGIGGKSLEAQDTLLKGGAEESKQGGSKSNGRYQEMGRKDGLSPMDQSEGKRAAQKGIDIDEFKAEHAS